jgi:hypothetical protein
MIKLPELNRHIVGPAAIALVIAGLGYATSVKRPSSSPQMAELADLQPATGWNPMAMLKEIPPNAFGRAPAAEQETQDNDGNAVSSTAKNWTAQDWRVAAEAVEKLRSSRAQSGVNMAGIVWAPPEEIAQKAAGETPR